MTEYEIVVLPDPADIVFDDHGTPILTFEDDHPGYGPGWVLYTNDGDAYFIGMRLRDIDRAERAASHHLALRSDDGGAS